MSEIDRLPLYELFLWSAYSEWRDQEAERLREEADLKARGIRPMRDLKKYLMGMGKKREAGDG